jgi:hypothetical protein
MEKCKKLTDAVEKVFLNHRAQILRAVGVAIRKFLGGSHHQIVNLPMTSVVELRGHRMAIAACFAFQREISSSVLWGFFDSIDPTETSTMHRGRRPEVNGRLFKTALFDVHR